MGYSSRFTIEDLAEIIAYAITFGIEGYVTLEIFVFALIVLMQIILKVIYKETKLALNGILIFSSLSIPTYIFLRLLNFEFFSSKDRIFNSPCNQHYTFYNC